MFGGQSNSLIHYQLISCKEIHKNYKKLTSQELFNNNSNFYNFSNLFPSAKKLKYFYSLNTGAKIEIAPSD